MAVKLISRVRASLFGLCVLLFGSVLPALAGEPALLVLTPAEQAVELWPAITVLDDPAARLSVDDLIDAPARFTRPGGSKASMGLRAGAVWLRVPVQAPANDDGDWVFNLDFAALDRLDLYLIQSGRVRDHFRLGRIQHAAQRPMAGRSHAVLLKLEPGERYELLMRAESMGPFILPVSLSKPSVFVADTQAEQMLQGLLTGIALSLIIYSLVQWAALREPLFAKYVLMSLGSLVFSLLHFGIGLQYLWTDHLVVERYIGGVSALLATVGSFTFIAEALSGPTSKRWFGWLMNTGALVSAIAAVLYVSRVISPSTVTALVSILGLLPVLFGLPGAIARAIKGDGVGQSFVIAWVVYFFTTAVIIQLIQGKVGYGFWSNHAFQIGSTLDMLLFMRVLSLRTKAAHEEARRVARERDAMHSLAHTDPLTGLANRRQLNLALEAALVDARVDNQVAVYVVDLDGFKPVNDRYGHDIGDELLVAVAARIRATVRAGDLVARVGGDEFVILTAGLNAGERAESLGRQLLEAFAEPFQLRQLSCTVGMTVGYTLAAQAGVRGTEMIKAADIAMYEGKVAGRNCLRYGPLLRPEVA